MAAERLDDGTLLNGRYRIVRALGSGGMGTVYMAEHLRLDTIVAVKEILGSTGDTGQDCCDLDGCEREARFLVHLNHPNLPKVTDAFLEGDRFYLVMQYIEGDTLEAVMRDPERGPLDVSQVIDWGLQIAGVLAYLHFQDPPIIFRDLKPANIMLQPDGGIRLIDFGIARRFQPGARKDTALLGSVGYSPPEQFGKHQTDVRSDIYAFAATLHHLLTGHDPAAQPFKFPQAHSLNPAVPEPLSTLLAACLAMEPSDRPATIEEVSRGLQSARDEIAVTKIAEQLAEPQRTNRKIVSSQLARYERSQRAHRLPGSLARATAVVAAVLLVATTATYALLHAKGAQPKPIHRSGPINPPAPMLAEAPMTAAPQDMSRSTAVPPTDAPTVIVGVGRVQQDPGGELLPIAVRTTLHGHAGSIATVAVFAYEPDGAALAAADRNSRYANPDGQLSVASRIPVADDQQPISVTLSLPLRQIPPQALSGPFRVRALVAVDGQNYYSEFAIITSVAMPLASPDSNGDTTTGGAGPAGGSDPQNGDGAGTVPTSGQSGRDESASSIVGGR